MIAVRVSRRVEADAWDAAIAATVGGSIFQTTQWAEYETAYLGAVAHYFSAHEGDRVVGRLLALEMPRTGEAVLGCRAAPVRGLLRPLVSALSWREGPVVESDADWNSVVCACFEAARELARERGVTGIEQSFLPLAFGDRSGVERAVEALGYQVRRRATVRIDLRRPVDVIWAALKSDVARTPVRKAERQGLQFVEVTTPAELERFYALIRAWRREQRLSRWPMEKYSLMREHLVRHATMFLAVHEGQPVGGAGLWHFADSAYLFSPVQSALARQQRTYAGDFLFWEMIRWSHARGFHTLDLSGVSVESGRGKDDGIRRFKEKWGGQRVEYPVFTLPVKRWRWAGLDAVRGIRG